MPFGWKLDESKNSMNSASIVGPGYMDTLDTIPEDVSVAATAAFQDPSGHNVRSLSTASAVGSFSSDSGSCDDEVGDVVGNKENYEEHHHYKNNQNNKKKDVTRRKNGRVKRPLQKNGTTRALAGGDNLSDTHASLGGVAESNEPLSFPPSETAPKGNTTTSIVVCTTRRALFNQVLVWALLALVGVGLYFIVTKVSANSMDATDDTFSMQPTQDPIFPPYNLDKDSHFPSNAPAYGEDDIIDLDAVLRNIPGIYASKMNDTSTPEGQCRYWLIHEDELELLVDVVGEKRVEQRYILCLFYYYTNGPYWTVDVEPWLNGELDECDWFGITCDADVVVGIELDQKNLNGTITEALLALSGLHLLRVQNNSIVGTIPENIFDALVELNWLDVSNNALTGTIPSGSTGNFTSLEALYVKGNQLEGGLPFFPNLQRVRAQRNLLTFIDERYATNGQSLIYLYAYNNQLSGSLPSTWNTPNLQILDLGYNNFTGPLPQELWDLPALQSLIVDNNQLSGTLPSTFDCQMFNQVWLNSNQLDGPFPSTFSWNCVNLTSLKLHGNRLTGTLPSTWNTPNLTILDLGTNNLTGPIPQELWDLPALRELMLDNNQFSGTIPTTSNCRTLNQVWLNSNQLDGSIPSTFGWNWVNLTSLKLQGNALTGFISDDHCSYWPMAAAASTTTTTTTSTLSESSNDWDLQADCNMATMQCECCTKCFPVINTNNQTRARYLKHKQTRGRYLKR